MDLTRLGRLAAATVDWFIRTILNEVPLEAHGGDLFKKKLPYQWQGDCERSPYSPSVRKASNKINARSAFSQNAGLHH